MNDLDIDLDRNTPWVDMSACVKFGLDRPSHLAGHMEHRYRQTDKHNAFYYIDDEYTTYIKYILLPSPLLSEWRRYCVAQHPSVTVLQHCVCVCSISLGGKGNELYPVLSSYRLKVKKRLKPRIALNGNPMTDLRSTECHLPYGITQVLPATRQN